MACTDTCTFENTGEIDEAERRDDARQVSSSYSDSSNRAADIAPSISTPFTAVNDVLNDDEMDAALDEYENEMLNEEDEMQWGLGDDPEGVEPCAQRMSRPTPGQSLQPMNDDDNCRQDIQYNENTVSRGEDADATLVSDDEDAMEDVRDDEDAVACRGQKRRLHTVCEMSYAARSKMIKHLENGVT